MRFALVAFAATVLTSAFLTAPAFAQDAAPKAWTVADIPWGPTAADGTRFALLEGDRTKAGAFSYAFFIPAGLLDGPHWHSQDARVFVAKGVLRLAYGKAVDKATLVSYPAGSYLVVPAGAAHFDGADEDTIILGVASGPWSTTYVDGGGRSAGTPAAVAPK